MRALDFTAALLLLLPMGTLSKTLGGTGNTFCVLQSDGHNYCFGSNADGKLGINETQAEKPFSSFPLRMLDVDNAVDVSVSANHICAVVDNGAGIKCVGSNYQGGLGDNTTDDRIIPVSVLGLGNSDISEVVCGSWSTCAILSPSNALRCWGLGASGQLGWGKYESTSQPVAPAGNLLDSGVTHISFGSSHACVITAVDGKLLCTGINFSGQLGDNTTLTRDTFTPVQGLGAGTGFVSVSCGEIHTCAVNADGGVICFGSMWDGQLGNGIVDSSQSTLLPVAVTGLSSGVSSVWCASYSSFAIMADTGAVKSWGQNYHAQLGSGAASGARSTPGNFSASLKGIADVRGGNTATCVLLSVGQDFNLQCLGSNSDGQLGRSVEDTSYSPTLLRVADLPDVPITVAPTLAPVPLTNTPTLRPTNVRYPFKAKEISGMYVTYCALQSNGHVYCWGGNIYGMLGINSTEEVYSEIPIRMRNVDHAVQISIGYYHGCLLEEAGLVKCVGANMGGPLGDGTMLDRALPVVAGSSSTLELNSVAKIHAGMLTTCALLKSGGLRCWGNNKYGQQGSNYTASTYLSPTPVPGYENSGVLAVSLVYEHTCLITTAGGYVKCAGHNDYGQLGDGTNTTRTEFTLVTGGLAASGGFSQIAAGLQYTCAVNAQRGVYCWGAGTFGRLGHGLETGSILPVQVIGLTSSLDKLVCGYGACFAIMDADRTVQSWGINLFNALGAENNQSRLAPGSFAQGRAMIQQVSNGYFMTCIVNQYDGVECIGARLVESDNPQSPNIVPMDTLTTMMYDVAPSPSSPSPPRSAAPTLADGATMAPSSSGSMETATRMGGGLLVMILAIMLG